jgi:hypothetical protein
MNKLTEAQKIILSKRINQYQDETWDQHAQWATEAFGTPITADECCKLFVELMFS